MLYRREFGEVRGLPPPNSTKPPLPAEAVSPFAYKSVSPLSEDTEGSYLIRGGQFSYALFSLCTMFRSLIRVKL